MQPPARLLHAMAHAETKNKKKKKKKETVEKGEPKHSKAARRFYNENFRDSEQRLSKILAASGGKICLSLDSSLLFLGVIVFT